MAHSFITKYITGNTYQQVLYAKVDWKNNDTDLFYIQIFDGETCWKGRFSQEFAEKYRENVDESVEEYNINVKNALAATDWLYTYQFTHDFDSSAFNWKKKHEDGTTTLHGSVPVHLQSGVPKHALLDMLLDVNSDLKKMITKYEQNIKLLSEELDKSRQDLEKFINAKNSLETTVYGKFVNLLNSKKKRIQALEHSLNAMNGVSETELD